MEDFEDSGETRGQGFEEGPGSAGFGADSHFLPVSDGPPTALPSAPSEQGQLWNGPAMYSYDPFDAPYEDEDEDPYQDEVGFGLGQHQPHGSPPAAAQYELQPQHNQLEALPHIAGPVEAEGGWGEQERGEQERGQQGLLPLQSGGSGAVAPPVHQSQQSYSESIEGAAAADSLAPQPTLPDVEADVGTEVGAEVEAEVEAEVGGEEQTEEQMQAGAERGDRDMQQGPGIEPGYVPVPVPAPAPLTVSLPETLSLSLPLSVPAPVALPEGWLRYETEEGWPFFFNTLTEQSCWELPGTTSPQQMTGSGQQGVGEGVGSGLEDATGSEAGAREGATVAKEATDVAVVQVQVQQEEEAAAHMQAPQLEGEGRGAGASDGCESVGGGDLDALQLESEAQRMEAELLQWRDELQLWQGQGQGQGLSVSQAPALSIVVEHSPQDGQRQAVAARSLSPPAPRTAEEVFGTPDADGGRDRAPSSNSASPAAAASALFSSPSSVPFSAPFSTSFSASSSASASPTHFFSPLTSAPRPGARLSPIPATVQQTAAAARQVEVEAAAEIQAEAALEAAAQAQVLLMEAVHKADVRDLGAALAAGADAWLADGEGLLPLHRLCLSPAANLLSDAHMLHALRCLAPCPTPAIRTGQDAGAEGAEADAAAAGAVDAGGNSAVHLCALSGNHKLLSCLLRLPAHRASAALPNLAGDSALQAAAKAGQLLCLQVLVLCNDPPAAAAVPALLQVSPRSVAVSGDTLQLSSHSRSLDSHERPPDRDSFSITNSSRSRDAVAEAGTGAGVQVEALVAAVREPWVQQVGAQQWQTRPARSSQPTSPSPSALASVSGSASGSALPSGGNVAALISDDSSSGGEGESPLMRGLRKQDRHGNHAGFFRDESWGEEGRWEQGEGGHSNPGHRAGNDADEYGDGYGQDGSGYDESGYSAGGIDASGYDASGYDVSGYDENGYDVDGYTAADYEAAGYTAAGYSAAGYSAATDHGAAGYSATEYDVDGYTAADYEAAGFSAAGFTAAHTVTGYDSAAGYGAGYDPSASSQAKAHPQPAHAFDGRGGAEVGLNRRPGGAGEVREAEDAGDAETELSAHDVAWMLYERSRDAGGFGVGGGEAEGFESGGDFLADAMRRGAQQGQGQGQYSAGAWTGAGVERTPARGTRGGRRASLRAGPGSGSQSQSSVGGGDYLEDEFFEAPAFDGRGTGGSEWVQCATAAGDLYYYNAQSQVVQWEDPFAQSDQAQTQAQTQATAEGRYVHSGYEGPDGYGSGKGKGKGEGFEEAGGAGADVRSPLDMLGHSSSRSQTRGSRVAAATGYGHTAAAFVAEPTPAPAPSVSGAFSASAPATVPSTDAPRRRGMVTQTVSASGGYYQHTSGGSSNNSAVGSGAAPAPAHYPFGQGKSVSSAPPTRPLSQAQFTGYREGADEFPDSLQAAAPTKPTAPTPAPVFAASLLAPVPVPVPVDANPGDYSGQEPDQDSDADMDAEDAGAQSTVASQLQPWGLGGGAGGTGGAGGRISFDGNRVSAQSISSLSDTENSVSELHGYRGGRGSPTLMQTQVQVRAERHSPRGGAEAVSQARLPVPTPVSAPAKAEAEAEADAGSQGSSEQQNAQRHLEVWDRFFRNALLVKGGGMEEEEDRQGRGYGLSQASVEESIRRVRRKAASSRSKGATAAARWPHVLSSRKYSALLGFALREGDAGDWGAGEQQRERALLGEGGTGSVSSIDGTLLSMALLAAALHEDVPCIEQLLRKGANPSCVDDQIRSPSHYAARTGNAEVLALLFDHGADLEAADAAGRTPLHTAVIFGRTRALDFLLGCAVDCDSPDLAGNAPLHLAARAGFLEGCAQLLRFGASPLARNLMGLAAAGVAQVMRPQTPQLQAVLRLLAEAAGKGELGADAEDDAGSMVDSGPGLAKATEGAGSRAAVSQHSQPQSGSGPGPGPGPGPGWHGDERSDTRHREQAQAQSQSRHPVQQVQEREQVREEEYEGEEGDIYDDDVDGNEDGDEDGEGDEEEEDGGNSVADLVASTVWGVAASLIDASLSMFSIASPTPSIKGGKTHKDKEHRDSRDRDRDDRDRDPPHSRTRADPRSLYVQDLPLPAPAGAGSLWQRFGMGGGSSEAERASVEASALAAMMGGAGGPPPPPPTDTELQRRGLGFPVPLRRNVSDDSNDSEGAPPFGVSGTPVRSVHGHGHGYVPPTPPSEVIVAVAMSKDRSRAEAWKQQAAAASGRRKKNAPAQPAPLYLPGGQGAAAVSAEARTRGGAAGAGAGGAAETQSLLLGDVSARDGPPRFSMMTPSGMAAAAPGDALSPVSESSGPPPSPAPLSRNSNGNGYSIGASLPRGVTWRYVDVLNKPS